MKTTIVATIAILCFAIISAFSIVSISATEGAKIPSLSEIEAKGYNERFRLRMLTLKQARKHFASYDYASGSFIKCIFIEAEGQQRDGWFFYIVNFADVETADSVLTIPHTELPKRDETGLCRT